MNSNSQSPKSLKEKIRICREKCHFFRWVSKNPLYFSLSVLLLYVFLTFIAMWLGRSWILIGCIAGIAFFLSFACAIKIFRMNKKHDPILWSLFGFILLFSILTILLYRSFSVYESGIIRTTAVDGIKAKLETTFAFLRVAPKDSIEFSAIKAEIDSINWKTLSNDIYDIALEKTSQSITPIDKARDITILDYLWSEHARKYLSEKRDWLAIVIAFFSFIFAMCTWKSQSDTQKNTLGFTSDVQKGILLDLPRHNYRNLIVAGAMEYKMTNGNNANGGEEETQSLYSLFYPAEEHFLKLKTDEQMLFPEAFDDSVERSSELHRFKLIIRNSNIEIETIMGRIIKPLLDVKIKKRDMIKLRKRMDLNTHVSTEQISSLYRQSRAYTAKEALNRLNQAINETKEKDLNRIVELLSTQDVTDHKYYLGKKTTEDENGKIIEVKDEYSDFVRAFFPDEEDLNKDKNEYNENRDIKQANHVNPAKKKEGWKVFITTREELVNIVNAEIALMIEKNTISLIPFPKK